jgi:hypothetical protein
MAISFTCPCGAPLKVNDSFANRLVLCPRCRNSTLVPDVSSVEEPEEVAVPEEESSERQSARSFQSGPIRAKPLSDEYASVVEDEPDDEEGDRPRKARPRMKRSHKLLLIIGGLLSIFFLLAGVGGVLGWYFFLRPSGLTDELTYMPDDLEWLASVKVATIVESDFYKTMEKEIKDTTPDYAELKDMEKEIGIGVKDIERVTVGGSFPRKVPGAKPSSDDEEFPMIIVIKSKKKVTLGDVYRSERYHMQVESNVGSYTMRVFEDRNKAGKKMAICVPDSKTIVAGPPEILQRVLKRGRKTELSDGMKEAMKNADFTEAAAVVFNFKDLIKDAVRSRALDLPSELSSVADVETIWQFLECGVIQFRLGSKVELEMKVLGKDSKVALIISVNQKTLVDMINSASKVKTRPPDVIKKSSAIGSKPPR